MLAADRMPVAGPRDAPLNRGYTVESRLHFARNSGDERLTDSPTRVAVTGAAGQIGYALLFRIASGQLLGPDTPVHLSLLEISDALKAVEGKAMELDDCAFPLLRGGEHSDDPNKAFEVTRVALS